MQIVATLCATWCFIVAASISYVAYEDIRDKISPAQSQLMTCGLALLGWIVTILNLLVAINV